MPKVTEQKRILRVYKKREHLVDNWRYSKLNPSCLYLLQSRDREFFASLNKLGIKSVVDLKILDVGCGNGDFLNFLVSAGFNPKKCFGVDIISDRIAIAKKTNPLINFYSLDAQKLPFKNESFDIIIQFTTFTSVLDKKIKNRIAKEMLRVLKPRGVIFWYDFVVHSPNNLDAKEIKAREIITLFPKCKMKFKKITLAPPIMRLLAKKFYLLPHIIERLKVFNTHFFVSIEKETIVENLGFQIQKISTKMLKSITKIHKIAFKNYPHNFLGDYYVYKFIEWFIKDQDAIALVAINQGNIVGYIVGAPSDYGRYLNKKLFPVVLLCLLMRPWTLFNHSVTELLYTRIISQIKNKNYKDAELTLSKPVFHLVSIVVDAKHRREGIGKKLFFEFKKMAINRGARSLVLSVRKNNYITRKFYHNLGWKVLQVSDNSVLKYFPLNKRIR